jgi:hypothetical protein
MAPSSESRCVACALRSSMSAKVATEVAAMAPSVGEAKLADTPRWICA